MFRLIDLFAINPFLNPSGEEGLSSKLNTLKLVCNQKFVGEFKACMQSGSHLDDHLKWISVLWSIFVTFWSLISAITEKVKLEILLRQRAILFSVNFQLIPLYVWSYSNQSIGIFDSRHDLYLVLRVPQSVYPNQVCLISLIWFDTAFGLLFVLIYLMIISGGIGPSQRDGASSSKPKG